MNMNNQIKYPVAEQFVSINGEGTKAGELAVFIRFKGCNLNCSYCDTQWANRQDTPAVEKTAAELVADVCRTGIDNVTMTGGEPLLQTELAGLIKELLSAGKAVEIETNGSVSLENVRAQVKHLTQERQSMERLSMTMDYKLAGSGMETFMRLQNFSELQPQDTVKFVAGSIEDLEKTRQIIQEYGLIQKCHVYISPVFGAIEPADIVEYMKSHQMNGVRMQLQMHKFIWAPDERGV